MLWTFVIFGFVNSELLYTFLTMSNGFTRPALKLRNKQNHDEARNIEIYSDYNQIVEKSK